MAQKKKFSVLLTIILFLAIVVFLFAAYQLVTIYMEYREGDEEYTSLSSQYVVPASPSSEKSSSPVIDFTSLTSLNSDICAWIQLPDTAIDYPVMQGIDNNEYMAKTFRGQKNKAGSIFMAAENQADFSDKNTILYGHNMKNGSMFHDLEKYKEEAFFKAHPSFTLYILDGRVFTCEVFSAHIAHSSDPYYNISFSSDEDFLDFANRMKQLSMFPCDVSIAASDRIVTLSTCSYEFDDARMVLHAKIIEQSLSLIHI